MNVNWKGVFPAVTTKFRDDDQLDLDMFATNIHAQLDAGVDGIILGGTLGESSTLTDAEKDTLVRTTVELAEGKVPVILNIAEQTTNGAIAAAENALKNGANGLMMLPPMRYKADDRETVAYYKAVANSTDLPIMVYNNPIDYKILVTLDMFEELAECPNIQAVKESTRDISNITRMINRFGDRFSILSGVDTLALESMFMGAQGWVAGLVCAFPRETVAIYRLVQARRYEEALTIYRWFLPLLELDINAKLVQNIKLAEVHTGIGTERVRAPRLPLEGAERENVLNIIESGIGARPTLPDYMNLGELVN
jgi:dihydrodipicolinate synthase/N-acetylneuraminate lyase